jgi:hypothetical protein
VGHKTQFSKHANMKPMHMKIYGRQLIGIILIHNLSYHMIAHLIAQQKPTSTLCDTHQDLTIAHLIIKIIILFTRTQ